MGSCPNCHRRYAGGTFCIDDGAPLLDDAGRGGLDEAIAIEADELPPTDVTVDRYRLLRKIGEGGMSEVFEAEHIHLGRRVALKLLRRELAEDAAAVARFRLEARTTSALGHPNVVRVVDSGTAADGSVYLAMDWLPGETLAERLARGPLAADIALEIVEQICDGLAAAHAAGVVHRDVKPGNVFLTSDSRGFLVAKVLDFGIAKLARVDGGLTRTGTFVGTPDYIAPEQALGEPVDGRADVYAVGVILYELLTGTVPFHGDTFMAVIQAHTLQRPEPPTGRAPERGIWRELEALVLRCLEKEPARRFASIALLGAAVHEARGGSAGSFYARLRAAGTEPGELGSSAPPSRRALPRAVVVDDGADADDGADEDDGSGGAARRRSWAWAIGGAAVVAAIAIGALVR